MWIELDGVRAGACAARQRGAALEDVSLGIERGDYVALLGPSGAGKSTLLFVLGCLVRPDAGSHWLDGKRVDALSDAERAHLRGRRIGMLFEATALVPELSVLENVEVPLLYQGMGRAERRMRAAGVLGELGLGSRLRRRPGDLSPGEQQRVALARACVGEPELLLVDEPTRGLDVRSGDEIMDLIASRSAFGATIVVATQDAARGRRAHRVVQICDGHVVRELAGGIRSGPRGALVRRLRARRRRR